MPLSVNFNSDARGKETPFTRTTRYQSVADGDVNMEISSVMEGFNDDDDDDDHEGDDADAPTVGTPSKYVRSLASSISSHMTSSSSSSSSSSSYSSTSTTATPVVNLLPQFERALEQARRVVFHPNNQPVKVHEFDWKVEFFPATTAGHKRKYDEDVEMQDTVEGNDADETATPPATSRTPLNNPSANVVSDTSSSSSTKRQSRKKASGFLRSFGKQKNDSSFGGSDKIGSSTPFGTHFGDDMGSNMSTWSQNTIVGNSIGSSNNSISTNSNNSFVRSVTGYAVANRFSSSYTRPAKRTKVEGSYHLVPSLEHGILKNRLAPPDAVTLNNAATTATPTFGSPASTRSLPQFQTSVVTPSPHRQSRTRRSGTRRQERGNNRKKQIRFVDSRMRVVKRLKSGNLFSFGNQGDSYQELGDGESGIGNDLLQAPNTS